MSNGHREFWKTFDCYRLQYLFVLGVHARSVALAVPSASGDEVRNVRILAPLQKCFLELWYILLASKV